MMKPIEIIRMRRKKLEADIQVLVNDFYEEVGMCDLNINVVLVDVSTHDHPYVLMPYKVEIQVKEL